MFGVGGLVGCKIPVIKEPMESCVISSTFGKAECGKRDMNLNNKTVGEFVGETKLKDISYCENCVCFLPKPWLVEMKPKLKEAARYLRNKRRRK